MDGPVRRPHPLELADGVQRGTEFTRAGSRSQTQLETEGRTTGRRRGCHDKLTRFGLRARYFGLGGWHERLQVEETHAKRLDRAERSHRGILAGDDVSKNHLVGAYVHNPEIDRCFTH